MNLLYKTGIAVFILIGVIVSLVFYKTHQKSVYMTYDSPDKKYQMVIYRYDTIMMSFPGQSSDAPGQVCLYDRRTGRLLNKCNVEMVQNIDRWEWTKTNLYIPLLADWPLPKD